MEYPLRLSLSRLFPSSYTFTTEGFRGSGVRVQAEYSARSPIPEIVPTPLSRRRAESDPDHPSCPIPSFSGPKIHIQPSDYRLPTYRIHAV